MQKRQENGGKGYTFFPAHALVELVSGIILLIVLGVLAVAMEGPMGEMANPADTTYVPRPEWYFMFLFEILKYFEGGLAVVGTFVLPLLVFVVLVCLPFYDKKPESRIRKRPVAAVCAALSVVLVVGLTIYSMAQDAKNPRIFKTIDFPPMTAEQIKEGDRLFASFCVLCHAMDGKGGFMAPDLTQIGGRASRTYIENVVRNPQLVSQKTIMSLVPLSDDELHAVSAYLSQKK